MSQEQSFDPELVEQTKQQIRVLVNEITQLSKSDITAEEFFSQFLQRVVSAIAAIGGVVWKIGDNGGLVLQCQENLREIGLGSDKEKQAEHSRLLYKSLKHPEGMICAPYSSAEEEGNMVGNPTASLILLAPLITEVETVGLIEVFQRADVPSATQKGYLRFLLQMCGLAVEFVRTGQLKHFADRQLLWNRVEEFTRTIHETLDPRATAFTIANEGRRLIECDRVSVAIRRGNKCRVEAVSGQDLFDRRSNVIRLLNKLATAVVSVEEPMWYTGDTSNFAPQVEKLVDEYVDEAHSKAVIVIPLIEPLREEDKEDYKKRQDNKKKPIGALIVEQIENSAIQTTLRQRVDVVERHACVALANSLEHNSLFLMPVWRAIGRWSWIVKARTLPKTILFGILALFLITLMFIFPYKFEVEAEGRLMPVYRQEIFASLNGEVLEVPAIHGMAVQGTKYDPRVQLDKKGRPISTVQAPDGTWHRVDLDKFVTARGTELVRLKSVDLSAQIVKLQGDLDRTVEEAQTIEKTLTQDRTMTPDDKVRQQGRLSELKGLVSAYMKELELLKRKQRDLVVYSPCDGQVITFDVREKLLNRPVQRGQVLMEVADPSKDWEIELFVAEKRIGLIREQQQKLKDGEELRVTFILASHPDRRLKGTIQEIHKTAEVRGERGNTVLIKVKIDKKQFEENDIKMNIGATVTGKVYCGERPIGYVWFYDLLAFIRQKIFFRLF